VTAVQVLSRVSHSTIGALNIKTNLSLTFVVVTGETDWSENALNDFMFYLNFKV